ncbi:MAG: ABC transporter permease [Candidatus Acidiferrales bacterium]
MPDWKQNVREHLRLPGLHAEREAEIVEDLAQQLEDAYRTARLRGASDEAARQQALAEIPDWDQFAADVQRADTRHARPSLDHAIDRLDQTVSSHEAFTPQKGWPIMFSSLTRDLLYSLRSLRKSPGFAVAAVLTLALGIGLNTTIFTWLKAIAIESLPGVERPRELVILTGMNRKGDGCCSGVAYLTLRDFNARSQTMAGILGWELITVNLSADNSETERVRGTIVTENYFDLLGVRAVAGRTFLPEEGQSPLTHPVAVISHGLWQRRFGGDPAIAGKQVRINNHPFTIIGVAPQGFGGAVTGLAFDIFVPTMMQGVVAPGRNLVMNRGAGWLDVVGRLKPGVSIAQARAEMDVIAQQIEKEHPGAFTDQTLGVFALLESPLGIAGMMFPVLAILMALVGLVLLIACANVANLLVARAVARRREIGVRIALGASRARLVRQLLTESVLLGLMAGAAGLLLGAWCSRAMVALLPLRDVPVGFNLRVDGYVLGFTLVVSLLTAVIFGLAPALRASRVDVATTLKDSGPSAGRLWWRGATVVAQIALAVVTLVCSGLFLRSLQNAKAADPGFDTSDALMISLDVFPNGYTPDAGRRFYAQLQERAAAMPGVRNVTLARRPPLMRRGARGTSIDEIEGYQPAANERLGSLYDSVGANYFATMGVPLVAGRDFTLADRQAAAPVVAVNETFARKFWPGQNALGKHIRIGSVWREVIAVARDVQFRDIGEPPGQYMYAPHQQAYEPDMTLIVRSAGDYGGLREAIRAEVRTLDPALPLFDARSMADHVNAALATQRASALLSTIFGLLALTLASIGVYSVLSYAITRRTHEFGIRVALGARPADVVRMVLGQGLTLGAIGLALGLAGAFAASGVLGEMLYGVAPTDPLTYAGIAALLIAVVLAACWLPARRAMRVDPMIALRHE